MFIETKIRRKQNQIRNKIYNNEYKINSIIDDLNVGVSNIEIKEKATKLVEYSTLIIALRTEYKNLEDLLRGG